MFGGPPDTSWVQAVVWGCGGLRSWIAEFLARAGSARLSLCDRLTPIGGGLLVRQDFVELDVGRTKAEAVASRVEAIRDDLEVEVVDGLIATRKLPRCDVLIDATVNRSVADLIEALWDRSDQTRLVARVFVDRPTCTLGALKVSWAAWARGFGSARSGVVARRPLRCRWPSFHPLR